MQCQQVLLDAFIAVEEVGGKFHVEVRQLCSVWLVGVATLSSGVFALLGTLVLVLAFHNLVSRHTPSNHGDIPLPI